MSIERGMLGAAIKRVRTARRMTQVELAKAAGLSKGGKSVALIEQGKRFVSVDTLNHLAKALDIPPSCLAVLGSRNSGRNKEAAAFLNSLQKLVSSVLLAEQAISQQESVIKKPRTIVKRRRRAPRKLVT